MPKKGFISNKIKPWIEARERYRLSHAQIQMARELGLSPKSFGKLKADPREEWRLPLPEYIDYLYQSKFGKSCPDDVRSLELKDREKREKKAARKSQSSCGSEPGPT
ncbi:hypothetical protein ACONUD_10125 [Microbulbifer harenosus]|uniref:hypothetical protein n=1 Tax=Microbulbifer harenosus TaxID=2576840 RepID=UPI0015F2ED07|nr:hypothetical protein [Microbulbifer harenosus]